MHSKCISCSMQTVHTGPLLRENRINVATAVYSLYLSAIIPCCLLTGTRYTLFYVQPVSN